MAIRSSYKDKAHQVKQVKRGVDEPASANIHSKRTVARNYKVIGTLYIWKDSTLGKYETLKDAEQAFENFSKKGSYTDLRIEGPDLPKTTDNKSKP
jgi:hypothetical protein